jgi:hypothetical protein
MLVGEEGKDNTSGSESTIYFKKNSAFHIHNGKTSLGAEVRKMSENFYVEKFNDLIKRQYLICLINIPHHLKHTKLDRLSDELTIDMIMS